MAKDSQIPVCRKNAFNAGFASKLTMIAENRNIGFCFMIRRDCEAESPELFLELWELVRGTRADEASAPRPEGELEGGELEGGELEGN